MTTKPRKSIPKVSAKRLAANPDLARQFSTIPRSSSQQGGRKTPVRKKKPRTAAEEAENFERKYGPKDYQDFTRGAPCACCGWVGNTEICHARNGGKGRKADWTETFPGCGPHWINFAGRLCVDGCNMLPERIGKRTFEKQIGKTLLQLAAEHQAKYRAHREASGEC